MRASFKGICAKIGEIINSTAFLNKSRVSNKYFTRKRKLGFAEIFVYILSNPKLSLQTGINHFLDIMGLDEMSYSAQAFSKRRQYIKPEAFKELVVITAKEFYETNEYKTWNGYLLTAIDGSKYNLPCNEKTEAEFDVQITKGEPQVQALGSCLYDVINGITIDAELVSCKGNERELAVNHIQALKDIKKPENGCIITFDRGYPSEKLISELEKNNIKYVMRCCNNFLPEFNVEKNDYVVTHKFKYSAQKHTFRILKVELKNETEYLITNLLDSFELNDFKELYQCRWGIETHYRTLKSFMEIENFSAVTPIAIKQDYYATLFLANLAAFIVYDMQDDFKEFHSKSTNKLQYRQNVCKTINELKTNVVKMILDPAFLNMHMIKIQTRLLRAVTAIRPNRSFLRKKKHREADFSNNIKNVVP